MARLEVITGPMFSGKSEELIRRLVREELAGKRILVVKPASDTRTPNFIAQRRKTADGKFELYNVFPAISIDGENGEQRLSQLILSPRTAPDILAVDEAQFFGVWFPELVRKLSLPPHRHYLDKIIVAGLDMDAWGRPFGFMPALLAMADTVTKLTAVCLECRDTKSPAVMTQMRGKSSGKQIEVGDAGRYEARCRACWTPPEE